jgi:hypothetical protein
MEPYDFALGAEAVHWFASQTSRQRETLIQIFDVLARHPLAAGDYREVGHSGRAFEVTLAEDVIVTWWADHAAKEVRIVRLERV